MAFWTLFIPCEFQRSEVAMIFISYRISDANDLVGWLDQKLADEFGADAVFRDKRSIHGGATFPGELAARVRACLVMLVIMGKTWSSVLADEGDFRYFPRLSDPSDWVRREIATALDLGKIVVPVFANGASMPPKSWLLNVGLERLAEIQGVPFRSDDFPTDFSKLVKLLRERCPTLSPAQSYPQHEQLPRRWTPAVLYPLQPAQHFAGREQLLKELIIWCVNPHDPKHVTALVAAGGTGKTALAERVISSLPGENPFGIFVWSFFENRRTEEFLREACRYFIGEIPNDTGALLDALQHGLRESALPHLFVLDGMEIIQAPGATGRLRGELEDPLLKRLLRWVAGGQGTHAKVLITSRFQLPDLEDYGGRGFRSIDLNDLDRPAACAVLRKRGVKGDDQVLGVLADSVHRHALTVDVMGLYLQRFGNGDPKNASKFDAGSFGEKNQKAQRLNAVLREYAARLPTVERDLLARLSLFPRGVTVGELEVIIRQGRSLAGALVGRAESEVSDMLEDLCKLGLVFRAENQAAQIYSAHPFLREFFSRLLGTTRPEQVHEAIRLSLAPSLEDRPDAHPIDAAELLQFERLIESTRLSGRESRAFDLYWNKLGHFDHLGGTLGNFSLGLRIVSGFSTEGDPAMMSPALSQSERALLLTEWGLYAVRQGDLNVARRAFDEDVRIPQDHQDVSVSYRNICQIELAAGRWKVAQCAAIRALNEAEKAGKDDRKDAHAQLATCLAGLGLLDEARSHFKEAANLEDEPFLYSDRGVWEAEFKIATGDQIGARTQTVANLIICRDSEWADDLARCRVLLGRCAVPTRMEAARKYLTRARKYARRSGDVEVILGSYYLAAGIARHAKRLKLAESEAASGIELADSGFGRWSLDIRIELANTHLAADRFKAAIDVADWVLSKSQQEDCQYAWGIADSLHLLGVAFAGLGEKSKAREFLSRAIDKRRYLNHAYEAQTAAELERLK
jgi:tetratricopeptide (TPR) repeat protein